MGPYSTHCLFPNTGESLVKQDSKQIQVDLQDLGYETCGRSENEADRDETTSPGKHTGPLSLSRVKCCIWTPEATPTHDEQWGRGVVTEGDPGPGKDRNFGELFKMGQPV